jgi:hypothetical protein
MAAGHSSFSPVLPRGLVGSRAATTNFSALSRPELGALLVAPLAEFEGLKQMIGEQSEQIARLKGL